MRILVSSAVVAALLLGPPLREPAQEPDRLVKAWGALIQGIESLQRHVRNRELSAVHSEDAPLARALSLLTTDSSTVPADARGQLEVALSALGRQIGDLHEAADAFDQAKTEATLAQVVTQYEGIKAHYAKDLLTAAGRLAAAYTCPMHPDVRGRSTDRCSKCGMELDQPVRIPLHNSGGTTPTRTVDAAIRTGAASAPGTQVDGVLTLTTFGRPVLITDLRVVHTEPIHLLVIDPTLTDYHHLHPRPTETPGDYAFSFTPRKPGPYRAWADVRTTVTGFQEYAIADIALSQSGAPAIDRDLRVQATSDGLRFDLLPGPGRIRVGETAVVKVRVADANGTPFRALEPVMATFAHLVGFNEDQKTVLHAHPAIAKALTPADRGGPELEFQLYPVRAGFYRLFVQVQVGGVSRFAAFGVEVLP